MCRTRIIELVGVVVPSQVCLEGRYGAMQGAPKAKIARSSTTTASGVITAETSTPGTKSYSVIQLEGGNPSHDLVVFLDGGFWSLWKG